MLKTVRLAFSCLAVIVYFVNALTVSGIVTDSTAGTPVEGIQVTLREGNQSRAYDTTDNLGAFSFDSVDTGSYTLRTRKSGYTDKAVSITVSGADPVTASIPVVKIVTTSISGKITDTLSGAALSNAVVRLGSGPNTIADTSGTDGVYTLNNVTTGNQTLRVSIDGYDSKSVSVAITGADPITLDIPLFKTVISSITGKITDSITGSVLSGAAVTLGSGASRITDSTGEDGVYLLDSVRSGAQTIRVTMTGYDSKTLSATISSTTPLALDIPLSRTIYSSITGKITDTTGVVLSGAEVRLRFGNTTLYDTTAADGIYGFTNVSTGSSYLKVTLGGYESKYDTVVVSSADPVTRDIKIIKALTGTISGKVTDSLTGAAMSGAEVRLRSGTSTVFDTTGADGLYTFTNVLVGEQFLRVALAGFNTIYDTVAITSADPVTCDFSLVKLSSISGKVTDSTNGTALAGAIVRLGFAAATGSSDTTAEDGVYMLGNISRGNQTIQISLPGYVSKNVTVNVPGSEPVTLDIQLVKAITTTLSGIITDSTSNAPLAGAVVRLTIGMTAISDTTGVDGAYTFANIEVGTYQLRVSATGYSSGNKTVTLSNSDPVTLNVAVNQRANAVLNELAAPGIPHFYISNNMVKLTNINGSGKITIYSLNGKILYQNSFERSSTRVILPNLIGCPYIVTIFSEGKTMTRTVVPLRK